MPTMFSITSTEVKGQRHQYKDASTVQTINGKIMLRTKT